MTGTAIPSVDRAVEAVRVHRARGEDRIALVGPPAAGKSSALRQLAADARRASKKVVEITFREHRDDDAAVVALAEAASQLGGDTLASLTAGGVRLESMLEQVEGALSARSQERPLVTIDASGLRRSPGPATGHFQRNTWTVFQRLANVRGPEVVVALDQGVSLTGFRVHALKTESDPRATLDPARWNGLGQAAQDLARKPPPWLRWLSPLQVRLLVGAIHVGVDLERIQGAPTTADLVRVMEPRLGRTLRSVLGDLSLVRTGFDDALLDVFGARELGAGDVKLLRDVFLFEDEEELHLHESIAHALAWPRDADRRVRAHERLAEHYRAAFQRHARERDVRRATRGQMEAVHHLSQIGSFDAIELSWFVDQLDALGKSLGIARRYAEAVEVYTKAIELDPEDAYAFHYRGFNRDVPGLEPELVEKDYRRAIEIDDAHGEVNLWHRQRLAYFLLTDAREDEALEVFLAASRDLGLDEGPNDPDVYRELHRPLAHLAIYRGALDVAETILAKIPTSDRASCAWLPALRQLLLGVREAREQRLVFAPWIPVEERWSGPRLFAQSDVSDWMPGRVEQQDNREIIFRVATREGGVERFGYLRLSPDEVRAAAAGTARFAAGTFVEIATLKRPKRRAIRPFAAAQGERLPPPYPRSERYLHELADAPR